MTPLPEYESPPLNEVAIGCRFEPISALTLPLVGAFWSTIRHEFPHTEHASPIMDVNGSVVVDEKTNLPWPRIWLLNDTRSKLIQIQRDRFVLNWRSRPGGEAYPRYPQLVREFSSNFEKFVQFVEDECEKADVAVTLCEATYVNHIDLTGDLEDLNLLAQRVFNGDSWLLPSELGTPTGFNWVNVYKLDSGIGQLSIKATPARVVEGKKPILALELNVQGDPMAAGLDNVTSWLNEAHDVIVKTFASITSVDIQRSKWGRK